MNTKATIQEVYSAFENDEIDSLPKTTLVKYIQALCCFNPMNTENGIKQLMKVQSLNTIYNVKVIEALDAKNTLLTRIVIILASLSFIATATQIYISLV